LERSSLSAGSKRPQREPTSVISLTMMRAESTVSESATVDFMMTVPLGWTSVSAEAKPGEDPVASTT